MRLSLLYSIMRNSSVVDPTVPEINIVSPGRTTTHFRTFEIFLFFYVLNRISYNTVVITESSCRRRDCICIQLKFCNFLIALKRVVHSRPQKVCMVSQVRTLGKKPVSTKEFPLTVTYKQTSRGGFRP